MLLGTRFLRWRPREFDMAGFNDKTDWMIIEAIMLFTAGGSAYIGVLESNKLMILLAFCLGMMTVAHHQNADF